MSCPSTTMRPESGRISPSTSFRIKLLPEPATPNSALVSPRFRWKETPRSTSFSANESTTSSNTMTGAAFSGFVTAMRSSGEVGADMESVESEHGHQESRHDQVERQDQHGSSDHGLGGGAAHALRAPARVHPVKAAYRRDDEAEEKRLGQPHEHILKYQRFPGVGPVLPGIETQQQLGDEQAPSQAYEVGNDGQEKQHEHRGGHARGDQLFHGVGAQRAHGVDLFGYHHRAEFAGHAGRIPSRYHQAGQHRPQLAHH